MNSNICPKCQAENREGNLYCTKCGTRLETDIKYGPRLVMIYGDRNEVVFPLKENRTTIGRDQENSIVLVDEKISKHHAAIIKESENFWIEDLNSKNGVFVNGAKISERKRIYNDNLIKLGSTIFKLRTLSN